ncbi:MAG TPA: hypothetical protein VG738_13130 [Chitinophagaceae bacterium]|nr:hypothetical protein [Chitinophagaceae bacterium]
MKKLTTVLIIGAAAGAAVWFFNTKKGKEVLGSLKDTSNDLAGKLKSGLDSVKKTTAGVVGKGKHYVNSMNNKVQESAN